MLTENSTPPKTKKTPNIPLRYAIIIPFVLQIVGAVSLVGYLSFKNGQKAVEDLVNQLMNKAGDRIQERLHSYLATPHSINAINSNAFQNNQLNLANFSQLQRIFWQQQQLFPSITSICFTNSKGEIIWTKKDPDGSFLVSILQASDRGNLRTYSLNRQGNIVKLEKIFPNYRPLQRTWYTQAKAAAKPTWTSIYPWIVELTVSIAAVQPLYEAPGKLTGVLSVDLSLSDISQFLHSLKISPSGQTFIMERSGEIVATSTLETPFITDQNQKTITRLKATDSSKELTQLTAKYLINHFADFKNIQTTQQLKFVQKSGTQFVRIVPYKDKYGLDWLIVIVVPENDFMAQINANTNTTIVLCSGAFIIAVGLGIFTARWIALPLRRISKASQAIAKGKLNQSVEITNINELALLAESFNQMTQQLQQYKDELENYSRSLEEQVNQRTAQLQQEIRDRQLLENKLRSSEAEVRAFFEAMTDIVLMIDTAQQNVKAAPTNYPRLYHYHQDVLNLTINRFFIDEHSEIFWNQVKQALDTQETIHFEYNLIVDNQTIWFVASISPASENIVVWVARDISDRKQAEESVRRSSVTNSMLSSISRAFLDRDIDTAINLTLQVIGEFTNSDRSYIIRYSETQNLMTNTHEWCTANIEPSIDKLQSIPIQSYPWVNQKILQGNIVQIPCIAELPPEANQEKSEFTHQSIKSIINLPINYQGKVVGLIGLDTIRHSKTWTDEDINLLKLVGEIIAIGIARSEAEIAQKQAAQTAFAANRAKSEFLANMSHELRTPLTAILGLSEVLRDEVFGPLTAKQHQKLATIEQSGQHLLELINDVLDLAKIESGKMELQLEPTDIQGLCEGSLAFVRQQAHQKQIKLSSHIPPRIGKVIVDERRMRQVLINLLSNAVKFTPEAGEVWIEVEIDREHEVVHFSVVDSGIGIAQEDISKLFQPFMQLDSSFTRRYKGTGLGLALVRQVVELHSGSVALESEIDRGSRFTVSLPWKPETISLSPPPPISPSQIHFSHNLQRVLIVEDSPPAAEQVARYLQELEVPNTLILSLGTGTVEEALRMKPDAIILDLQLPDRSGWDVLSQLKANPQTQDIPVLIISVVDEPGKAEEWGVAAYIVKPFSRSQFQIAWRKFLFAHQRSTPSTPPEETSSPLILLAEDNETNLSTIVEYLEVKGYRVAIALNGREAVQLNQELKPNLILMDIQMPEMDGLEATRQIRSTRDEFTNPSPRIPIIALTSLAMPGDREKCLAAGVDEYLAKPVSLKKLVETIEHYLNQSKS